MSTAKTRDSKKSEQRKAHSFEDAKAEIDRKCNLYPGYREVVEDVRDVLHFLGDRNTMSSFDMDHKHRQPGAANKTPLDDVGH